MSALLELKTERPLKHLMRAVWLQALRHNEIYVLAILLGIYAAGAAVMRVVGIGSAQTARFITDLGLQLGSLLASLLVILMAARQMPLELELRTIYPVLAKPVTRAQVLLGKALPTWAVGVAGMGLFTLATLALTPRLPYQHAAVLAEAFALKAAALAMLTALTFWLSLWLPLAVTMLVAGAAAFLGTTAANLLLHAAGGTRVGAFLAGAIPDFSLLQQFGRYVDGGAALAPGALLGFLGYAALWTTVFWALAVWRFRRMAL